MSVAGESSVDWGASGRTDSYSFALVDPFTLGEVGTMEAEESASSITYSYTSENHMQASLDVALGDYMQDGYHRMVRVYHDVTVGGFSGRYSMGTFFVENVSNSALNGMERRKLSCYGPMWRYTQDVLARDFVRHVGDNVVDCIRDIIQYDGGKLSIGDGVDTSRTHTREIFFSVGYNRADTLNMYASWINCEIVSGYDGTIVLRGYTPPGDRLPIYTFENGANCVYLPGADVTTNRDEPINRVVAYFSRESKPDDDPYPLSDSCYINVPESHPFSFERCGRRRTEVMQVSDPCDHETLVAQAQRRLDEGSAEITYVEIEHANVPFLKVGDCVRYVNGVDFKQGYETTAIIEEMSVQSLGPMCMTKTKLRCYG